MSKKMKKQGGFTLIEMLIVVAIIAILVAVSIPVVNNSLERARQATDAANERAAKAAILIMYLTDEDTAEYSVDAPGYYHADTGKIDAVEPVGEGYGKCTYHQGDYLKVWLENDEARVEWSSGEPAHNGVVSAP